MAKPKLSDWLEQRVTKQTRMCLLAPLGLIPAAFGLTFITWWVIWFTLLMGFGALGVGVNGISIATWCVVGVLFVWQFTAGRSHQEKWEFSGKPVGAADVVIRVVTGSPFASLALDPAAGKMFLQLIALLLCIGPRLVVLAWDLTQQGLRLKSMNIAGCSAILGKLMKSQSRVAVEDLYRNLRDEDLATTIPQLRDIDGVVFLTSEPISLTLAPRLRDDFQEWLKEAASEGESFKQ